MAHRPTQATPRTPTSPQGNPWLGVMFKCCGVYGRIYRNAEKTHYRGACPRCGGPVKAKIGSGGTNRRFFEAR